MLSSPLTHKGNEKRKVKEFSYVTYLNKKWMFRLNLKAPDNYNSVCLLYWTFLYTVFFDLYVYWFVTWKSFSWYTAFLVCSFTFGYKIHVQSQFFCILCMIIKCWRALHNAHYTESTGKVNCILRQIGSSFLLLWSTVFLPLNCFRTCDLMYSFGFWYLLPYVVLYFFLYL